DYDPTANTIVQVASSEVDLSVAPYVTRMLMLPSGEVLFGNSSSQLYLFTPVGSPDSAWRPTISSISRNSSNTFTLSGTQLNGISEGTSYGDDAEMSTNYPIVRITDGSGKVT